MAIAAAPTRFQNFPVIIALPVIYALVLALYAGANGSLALFGIGALLTIAAGLTGACTGFLFGMPRDLSGTPPPPDPAPDAPGRAEILKSGWANNNLVEVSDWLTKIIVGIALIQFTEITGWIGTTGAAAGQAAGLLPGSAATFGVAALLSGFVYGFLLAYIYARTIIALMFATAQKDVEATLQAAVARANDALRAANARAEAVRRGVDAVIAQLPPDARGPSAVLAALYKPEPESFAEAIPLARDLLMRPEYKANPQLYAQLACGLGQKYGYESARAAPPETLVPLADEALAALGTALALDPGLKPGLRALWSPEDPAHRAGEDDLTPFWQDAVQRPRFAEVLA